MQKNNAFVKISGDLITNKPVIDWLKCMSNKFFLVLCIGGGKQINEAFKKNGLDIQFDTLGRITKTLEERQIARNILEKNQVIFQDLLFKTGVHARVIIPVIDMSSVLCHVNGDVMVLSAYNGFDKIFILTLDERRKAKIEWVEKIGHCFSTHSSLDKIDVIGF